MCVFIVCVCVFVYVCVYVCECVYVCVYVCMLTCLHHCSDARDINEIKPQIDMRTAKIDYNVGI